ncbi:hypothetical protein BpHYR1_026136 [Brachionus plicatilis]|uniref:Uncharacterized protein n=1 Tax=Brachionus plicatilis TaxID=10195 RepID=A0A3M7T7R0_BRAPC|nr:hypothetical protein BpHYR1_026136 [Brachionus plicatilis]
MDFYSESFNSIKIKFIVIIIIIVRTNINIFLHFNYRRFNSFFTIYLNENIIMKRIIFYWDNLEIFHHNSAVSRSQAQDEKIGGWWQPHYVVFYESEEELYTDT